MTSKMAIVFVFLMTLVASAMFSSRAEAKLWGGPSSGPFGIGLILGEPTALNGKYDIDANDAVDGALAFDLNKWLLVYSDYQYKFAGAFSSQRGLSQVTPYIGVGGVLVESNTSLDDTRHYQYFTNTTDSKIAFGIRVPLGFEWRPSSHLGIFAEIAPGIAIIPGTTSFFQGGLGIRFYF